jgi:hypothetical protein
MQEPYNRLLQIQEPYNRLLQMQEPQKWPLQITPWLAQQWPLQMTPWLAQRWLPVRERQLPFSHWGSILMWRIVCGATTLHLLCLPFRMPRTCATLGFRKIQNANISSKQTNEYENACAGTSAESFAQTDERV